MPDLSLMSTRDPGTPGAAKEVVDDGDGLPRLALDAGEIFRVLAENAPNVIYLCRNDERYRMLFINSPVADLTGYSPADFLADRISFVDLYHPEDARRIPCEVDQAIARRERFDLVYRLRHRKGDWRWVEESGVGVFDSGGRLQYLQGMLADVTERRQAEEKLLQSEASFRSLFDNVQETVYVQDGEGRFLTVNAGAERMYGYPRDWFAGKSPEVLSAPGHNDLDAVRRAHARALAGTPQSIEFWGQRADGSIFPKDVRLAAGTWFGRRVVFALARDITERKRADERLRLASSVFEHADEAIMVTNPGGVIIEVNRAFSRITGYRRSEVLGRDARLLRSDRHPRSFYESMQHELLDTGSWRGEIWGQRKHGEVFPAMQTISVVLDEHRQVRHYVSLFSDITALKEHEQRLEHRALHDPLTELPNRALLADRLQQAIRRARRHQGVVAVAYVDLDGFKEINDRHGHEVGDLFLVTLVERVRATLRECDTLARLGGDEFVLVLPELTRREQSGPVLDRLLQVIAQPLEVRSESLSVSASIGVTYYPQQDTSVEPDQLIRQADQAMYQAKQAGKNRYQAFDAEHERAMRGRYDSLNRIDQALANDEFVLHYQPKVNMQSGRWIGVEALLRWQHPERGLLLPESFLPMIEQHPLGIVVGQKVLAQAVAQAGKWSSEGQRMPVSVNISAAQLGQRGFADMLKRLLSDHPELDAPDLELEVTETSAFDDFERFSRVMATCCDMGVRFAVDDFGTGYSSLSYLKKLPASTLKIDRSFVRDLLDDPEDLAILDGILRLASSVRRRVVAEGVETIAQGRALLRLGCEFGQGFAIARPMPAGDLAQWMESWRPPSSWQQADALDRQHLPMLFALVEHRAWMAELCRCARAGNPTCAAPDLRAARFEQALDRLSASDALWSQVLGPARSRHAAMVEIAARLPNLIAADDQAGVHDVLARLEQASSELQSLLEVTV